MSFQSPGTPKGSCIPNISPWNHQFFMTCLVNSFRGYYWNYYRSYKKKKKEEEEQWHWRQLEISVVLLESTKTQRTDQGKVQWLGCMSSMCLIWAWFLALYDPYESWVQSWILLSIQVWLWRPQSTTGMAWLMLSSLDSLNFSVVPLHWTKFQLVKTCQWYLRPPEHCSGALQHNDMYLLLQYYAE